MYQKGLPVSGIYYSPNYLNLSAPYQKQAMDRRDSLRKILWASGTVLTLPAWAHGWQIDDVAGFSNSFSTSQSDLLSSVVDTIIPSSTDGVGGLSVGVDEFLKKLLEQCYDEEVNENVKLQLDKLEDKAKGIYGRSFEACLPVEHVSLLLAFEASEDEAENSFFNLIKRETIRGFRTSRQVMTRYHKYRVAPGFYDGCKNVEVQ